MYTQAPRSVSPTSCSNGKVVTKNVQHILRKNEENFSKHIQLMWRVCDTFSGGILTQAVFGGGQRPLRQQHAKNYELSAAIPTSTSASTICCKNSFQCAAFRAFHSYPTSIERKFFNLALIGLCGSSEGFILFFLRK